MCKIGSKSAKSLVISPGGKSPAGIVEGISRKMSASMINVFIYLLSIFLSLTSIVLADPEPSIRPFFLISIPKSGTHLNAKLLSMLTNRNLFDLDCVPDVCKDDYKGFEGFILERHAHNEFVRCHTYPINTDYIYWIGISRLFNFVSEHSEYLTILQIRDLRDVIVSIAYHFSDEDWDEEIGGPHTFDQRLVYILNQGGRTPGYLHDLVKSAIDNWMCLPNIMIVRFEDLVGSKGGGNDEKQQEVICSIASNLGIPLSAENLDEISDKLFGDRNGPPISITFREGKIGSWKQHYKSHHMELFKKKWTHYQLALGYDDDDMG